MSNLFELHKSWGNAAIEAAEVAVQSARETLDLACARNTSGVAAIEEVWLHADLLMRELQSQLDVATVLNAQHWIDLAHARLYQHKSELSELQQAYAQGRLQPSEVAFTDLDGAPAATESLVFEESVVLRAA